MKTKKILRHTCEGRYPVSVGFSESLDSCLRRNDDVFKVSGTVLMRSIKYVNIRWVFIFLLCLMPFVLLLFDIFNENLGPNPAESINRYLGSWGLYFLFIGLSIAPIRKLLKIKWLVRYRRMIGLFAFFYINMHFLSYIWFDQFFNLDEIIQDIFKRPFISVGFMGYLLLVPLAFTSTTRMMVRLKKNWQRLHKLIYPVSMLALLHYFMMIKTDYFVPIVMSVILSGLFGFRFVESNKRKREQRK